MYKPPQKFYNCVNDHEYPNFIELGVVEDFETEGNA